MDGKDFLGSWLVIAGKIPGDSTVYHAHIKEHPNGDAFQITYSVNGERTNFKQTLHFDEATHTLNSDPDDGKPQRCVAMWKRPKGRKTCVFAMWVAKGSSEAGLAWEVGDNGSWGAEAGAPVMP